MQRTIAWLIEYSYVFFISYLFIKYYRYIVNASNKYLLASVEECNRYYVLSMLVAKKRLDAMLRSKKTMSQIKHMAQQQISRLEYTSVMEIKRSRVGYLFRSLNIMCQCIVKTDQIIRHSIEMLSNTHIDSIIALIFTYPI